MQNANLSDTFKIAGRVEVVRLGFGSMRLTGKGIWGPPEDPHEARRVLSSLQDLGINFVDTADSYGPFIAEDLIAEVLHPYSGLFVATKGGLIRPGPTTGGGWPVLGNPDYLRQCVKMSLRRLKVERIDLWQLHRIDPKVPRDEQFEVIKEFLDQGLIRFAGLSQVTIEDIKAAQKVFPVATVQNRFNLSDRADEAVLDFCEKQGIGFIPWAPLAAGALSKSGNLLEELAKAKGASRNQIAISWMLQRSPAMLPIPGTSRLQHLKENVAGAAIRLSQGEFDSLSGSSKAATQAS